VPLPACGAELREVLFALALCAADCQLVPDWLAELPPVVPVWLAVTVFGCELPAVADCVLVGLAVAVPWFEVDPPVAVTAPDWLKLTPRLFSTTAPTTSAWVLLLPVLPPLPPTAATVLPSPPEPLRVPVWLLLALPFSPVVYAPAAPAVFVAVGVLLAMPVAAPPMPPVAVESLPSASLLLEPPLPPAPPLPP
jgi:hypothetical protein